VNDQPISQALPQQVGIAGWLADQVQLQIMSLGQWLVESVGVGGLVREMALALMIYGSWTAQF
jgi:hypothetical protein